jgi:hypothetical protein
VGPSIETVAKPRSGASYDAHSYHTKVPPAAIAELIRRNLPGGGVVADSFCGSGTTGVAAAIAEAGLAAPARYDVVLGDLSPFASFIAEVLNSPPRPSDFEREASAVLRAADAEMASYWTARHDDGRGGTILYTIWSEVFVCPGCAAPVRFWDLAVKPDGGEVLRTMECHCGECFRKEQAERVLERVHDAMAERWVERPLRVPVLLVYEVDGERFERPPNAEDLALIEASSQLAAPAACPNLPMLNRDGPWGDLYRAGYHQGITHVHNFYTWRNFVTIGHLWEAAGHSALPQAARFLVSSYNLSHSTLMSRIVFKRGQSKPVLTGYQTGTLYISSLPVEKNPFIGLARKKLPSISRAFAITSGRRGSVEMVKGPAKAWASLDRKIDYAFVDPPFGGNIPYAEANFIAEAWLGEFTDRADEATISKAEERTPEDYRQALGESLDALRGRLRPSSKLTVMFHSADREIWDALVGALDDAHLAVDDVLVLDKRQSSFKQVRSEGAVEGDILIDTRPVASTVFVGTPLASVAPVSWLERVFEVETEDLDVEAKRRLFSRYLVECLKVGAKIELSAGDFYRAADEASIAARSRAVEPITVP